MRRHLDAWEGEVLWRGNASSGRGRLPSAVPLASGREMLPLQIQDSIVACQDKELRAHAVEVG